MFNLLGSARKGARAVLAVVAAAALSACDVDLSQVGGGASGAKSDGSAVNVALLVPYGSATPGDDGLARALENAARMAAADLGAGKVNITVYKTAGQAGTAASVASQAVAAGADIILGPLRSDAANAAAVAVAGSKVNVISFSNNTSIAGGNLFVLGNTFDSIASRLMGYASSQGRSRVVVVYPRTPVGQIARSAIVKATAGTNVQIVGDGSFEFSEQGIVSAVPTIANTIKESGATAIMLTSDSTGALPLLAQLLPEKGISPSVTKYIGLTRWDVPPQTLSLPGVQGGWFALPDPAPVAQFNSRYRSTYGDSAHPLAGLAYDGIAAVGALAAKKLAMTKGNLTQSSGFKGVNGVFRFKADGTNQRAMAVAQVTNNQVQIIDPAPKSFGFGGF
ncbi:amino acid/amide ABC transporter substrate-binding protein, HAAT family [Litoreibacter ascidiaceicola]|uniref:Amino acid/amide ABC transporter substrate-binding protein, HAAT family n=2 Tax=Litoreibacter TaxID=947567 RepID=A0A1M4ZAH5_9RHOB|nr:penicillin-binding protein activator [Litoreibacter ascidiaceicola]SHF15041.1 amino acid/amide ABC transporter substrate-binding protein, HAAT family [Litoreibacter ascidiaceicola]